MEKSEPKHSIITRISAFDRRWICKINLKTYNPVVDIFFKVFSHVGSFIFWLGLAGVLYLFDEYTLSFWVYATCLNGGVIVLPIKYIFRRDRPFIDKEVKCTIIKRDRFVFDKRTSFPSGHCAYYCSCSIVLLFTLGYWWLYLVLIPFAILVGYTRINLGAHFPSDVIFGFIIGVIIAITTILLFHVYLPFFSALSEILTYIWHIFFP